jgi:hypothetical protein
VGEVADFFVGLDLGQLQDHTALAVVGLDAAYLEISRDEAAAYERLLRASKDPHLDEIDLRSIEREIEAEVGPIPDPIYEVRHLERIPLRTPYTEVAQRVKALMETPPLAGNAELAVDATGVGLAVTDHLRDKGLGFKRVIITSGEKETRDGHTYRVPKKDLIARTQVLLEKGHRRLRIAPSLPEAKTLVEELLNYRYRITDAGNDTYGPWRDGQHDDLLLAVCLAVWAADRRSPLVDETLVEAGGPFSISEKDLYTLDDNYFLW